MDAFKRMELIASYILDTENEDFYENPDRNHIYYHAVALMDGERIAEKMYLQVIEEHEL